MSRAPAGQMITSWVCLPSFERSIPRSRTPRREDRVRGIVTATKAPSPTEQKMIFCRCCSSQFRNST